MQRRFRLVLMVFVAIIALAGSAQANPMAIPSPIGNPFLESLGWWEQDINGAYVDVIPGGAPQHNNASARFHGGPGAVQGEGGQVFLSTPLGTVPGVTKLSLLDRLSYWTYTYPSSPNPGLAPTLQIAVDVDGGLVGNPAALPSWDTTLVFEPGNQGFAATPVSVTPGTWQFWNTLQGAWHSTRDLGVAGDFAKAQSTKFSWQSFRQRFPNAAVSLIPSDFGGPIRLQFGSTSGGYQNVVALADDVVIKVQAGAFPPGVELDFDLLPKLLP